MKNKEGVGLSALTQLFSSYSTKAYLSALSGPACVCLSSVSYFITLSTTPIPCAFLGIRQFEIGPNIVQTRHGLYHILYRQGMVCLYLRHALSLPDNLFDKIFTIDQHLHQINPTGQITNIQTIIVGLNYYLPHYINQLYGFYIGFNYYLIAILP